MTSAKILREFLDELEICDNSNHFKSILGNINKEITKNYEAEPHIELKTFFYSSIFGKIIKEIIFFEKRTKDLFSEEDFILNLKNICSLEINQLADPGLCFDTWYAILEEVQGRKIVSDLQSKIISKRVITLSSLIHENLFGDDLAISKLLRSIFTIANKHLLQSYLQKLLSYITLLVNICEGNLNNKLTEIDYYRNLSQSIFEYSNEQLTKELASRYIILGKGDLLVEYIYSAGDYKKTKQFIFLKKELTSLNHNYKIVKILLKNSGKLSSKHCPPSQGQLQKEVCIFLDVLKNFSVKAVIGILLDKVLFNDNIPAAAAKTMLAYFKEVSIDKETMKMITLQILRNWGNVEFLRFASKQQQKFLSNLLKFCLDFLQVEDLNDEELLQYLQTGIQIRFEYQTSFSFVKESGHMIWKCLRKILKVEHSADDGTQGEYDDFDKFPDFLEDSDQEDGTEVGIISNSTAQKNETKDPGGEKPTGKTDEAARNLIEEFIDTEEAEEFIDVDLKYQNDNPLIFTAPKHLYDCLLGLQQEADRTRFEQSLKYLNYLIRKNLDDLDMICEELAGTLLRLHEGLFHVETFTLLRRRAMIALAIMKPLKVSKVLIKRFYYSECSMGDRLMLIDILKDAAQELADHPEKYTAEKFNEYEGDSQEFNFKKVTSRIFTEEEKQMNKILSQKKEKVEENSRRWGDTKRAFLDLNKAEDDANRLKKIEKGELLIIKKDHKKDFFINRFNELCISFFYPLLVPMRMEKSKYMGETAILGSMMLLITTYLECAKNAHFFHDLCLEGLDFILSFIQITELNFTRALLQSLYKISIFINKNVVMSYPLLVDKLMETAKTLTSMQQKETQDTAAKYIISEILNNINKIFAIPTGI